MKALLVSKRSALVLAQSFGLAAVLALSGCASKMTKQECQTTDFYQMGVDDGGHGRTSDRYSQLSQECKQDGIALPDQKYSYGRQVGLAKYCSDSLAKKEAKAGKTDTICLREKVPPYQTAYAQALNDMKASAAADLKAVQQSQAKEAQKQSELQSKLQQIDQQQKSTPTN